MSLVRDGSITAKVMFRASANDAAKVSYATGSDPKSVSDWGERGSLTYSGANSTMVSTLGLNAQSDTSLRADLFGEVKLNFVSETLPLDRLADAAKVALVQRNSAVGRTAPPAVAPAPAHRPRRPPPAAGRRVMLRELATVLEDLHRGMQAADRPRERQRAHRPGRDDAAGGQSRSCSRTAAARCWST